MHTSYIVVRDVVVCSYLRCNFSCLELIDCCGFLATLVALCFSGKRLLVRAHTFSKKLLGFDKLA